MQTISKELFTNIRNDPYYSEYNQKIISLADSILDTPIEVLSYQNHMFFYRYGFRDDAQRSARRENLSLLATAYLLTENQTYLDRAEDYIWAICDQFSWALPAHLQAEKCAHPVPFETQPYYIELVAAGTAALLAEIDAALNDALSVRIRKRIRMEVDRRIFTPFETRMHDLFWENVIHNWASVCASNLGIAYIHLAPKERFLAVLPRLKRSIDNFLGGYDTDGCCLEGFAYWNYGFGEFLPFADLLCRYTNGEDDYFKDEKVHRIALFAQNVIVGDGHVVNFADGGDRVQFPLAAIHLFSSKYNDIVLPNKQNFNLTKIAEGRIPSFIASMRNYLWIRPELDGRLTERSYHHYMDKAEWFIEKNEHYSLVAKGGHNAEPYHKSYEDWQSRYENRGDRNEPHNHNDVGHFIFYHGSECVLCDLGAGLYYQDYFLPEHRYKYLVASSRGHSVPIVNGQEQCRDIYHGARVLSVDEHTFSIDIAGAYDLDALKGLIRTFRTDECGVTLEDTYHVSSPTEITERFVSKIQPLQEGNVLHIGCGTLTFPENVTYTLTSQTFMNHSNKEETAYLMDFTFTAYEGTTVCFQMR